MYLRVPVEGDNGDVHTGEYDAQQGHPAEVGRITTGHDPKASANEVSMLNEELRVFHLMRTPAACIRRSVLRPSAHSAQP